MREPRTERISVSLSAEQFDKLNRLAKAESRSRSNMIAWLIHVQPEPKDRS